MTTSPLRLLALAAVAFSAVTAVAQSALKPFRPTGATPSGGAVLIVGETADAEALARWLNTRDIAGFTVPANTSAADLSRAVGELRSRAAEFKIAPNRIALLGLGAGSAVAAEAGYTEDAATRPNLLTLVWGGSAPAAALKADATPTLLIGSTATADNMGGQIELWTKLRNARASVDAHFFAKADAKAGLGGDNLSLSTWPEVFYAWSRFNGLLTDQPRVGLKGMVYVDGAELPHGYVVLTPVGFVGAGPIIARVLNSTQGVPIGQFTVPAAQGAIAGRYKVDVKQTMTRWLSNSFSGGLVGGGRGGGTLTPEQIYFGHHRVLAPTVSDLRSFTKVRPTDKDDYIIEIKPGAEANSELRIEVFSGAKATPMPADLAANPNLGGFLGGPKNPGQVAYVEQLKRGAFGKADGIPEPVLLWPKGAPDAKPDADGVFTDEDKPAVYAFPAPANNSTGAAFLILPGGAFTNRCMDNEGVQIAKFLNQHGISGFVLRYRIGPNYPRSMSVVDAHRAMRYIRGNAATYKLNPDKLGVIGFSAGGELQGDAFYNGVVEGDPNAADPLDRLSTKANFSVLIYGGRNVQNPASAPPTFTFCTVEDGSSQFGPGPRGVLVSAMNSLRGAGVPFEAHFYQVGPHGTAMGVGDPQLGQWPALMIRWLVNGGYVPGAKATASVPFRL